MTYQQMFKLIIGIVGTGIVACVVAYLITKPGGD